MADDEALEYYRALTGVMMTLLTDMSTVRVVHICVNRTYYM